MSQKNSVVIMGANGFVFVARNFRKFLYEKNLKVISISRKTSNLIQMKQKIISKNYLEKDIISK